MKQNPISKLLNAIVNSDYIDKWSVIHAFAGASIAWLCKWFMGPVYSVLVVLAIALLWEIYEYIEEGIEPYRSAEVWRKNSMADIVIALVFGSLVVL